MPHPPYILTPRATEQFEALLYNLAEHSGWERSIRVEERLYEAFNGIAAHPGIGHLRRDLLPREIYFHYVEPFHILYLRDTSPLWIIAIHHGSRDIAALMRDESS
jgi:plasmid stabilization system protein ParE